MFAEVSFHGPLAPLLWSCGEAACCDKSELGRASCSRRDCQMQGENENLAGGHAPFALVSFMCPEY